MNNRTKGVGWLGGYNPMPYISNAIREWLKWQPLRLAIEQICVADECSSEEAIKQLRSAIADGNVQVRWGDNPKRFVNAPSYDSDIPPCDASWWHRADIRIDGDAPYVTFRDEDLVNGYYESLDQALVKDDVCLEEFRRAPNGAEPVEDRQCRFEKALEEVRFRPLLVSSKAIDSVWGWPWPITRSTGNPSQTSSVLSTKPLRIKVSEEQILHVAQEMYRSAGNNPPNMVLAEQRIRAKLPGAKRDFIRAVLKTFADRRRAAGNQPKV